MIRVDLLSYGDRGGGHALLASTLPERSLPPGLGQRVDRPAGLDAPWSPFWGCGPAGDRWALWWGEEDRAASRAGMVRSRVALMTLDQVRRLSRLEPLFDAVRSAEPGLFETLELDEGGLSDAPEAPGLGGLAPLLLDASQPVRVLLGREAAVGVACALWARLWPAARARFACRVALGPEHVERSEGLCFVVSPVETRPRWRGYRIADPALPSTPPTSGAEAWLRGMEATDIELLLRAVDDVLPAEIAALSKLDRIAEARRLVHAGAGLDSAILGLRALQELDPVAPRLPELCAAIRDAISGGLARADLQHLLSLSNVNAALLPHGEPVLAAAVAARVGTGLTDAPDDDALKVLQRQAEPRFQPWWRSAVRDALQRHLDVPSATWATALWRWWQARVEAVEWADGLLGATAAAERAMVGASPTTMPPALAGRLRELATGRGWPELYARTLLALEPTDDAFAVLRAFSSAPERGIPVLMRGLPLDAGLRAALSLEWPALTDAVAARTLRDRALLLEMDPGHRGWRALWTSRIRQGGGAWDGLPDPDRHFRELVELAARGDADAIALAERLVDTRHGHALRHPERATLWARLPPPLRGQLLQTTARVWMEAVEAGGDDPGAPEHVLVTVLLEQARQRLAEPGVPSRLVARCVEALPDTQSDEVLAWIRNCQVPMPRDVAERLGRTLLARRLHEVARALYGDARHRADLKPLLHACPDLLTWMQRIFLSSYAGEASPLALQRAVAEVGSTVMPAGPTMALWEEAGFDPSQLSLDATGEARWDQAVRQAVRIANHDGLSDIVKALRKQFKWNRELEQLSRLLDEQR